MDALAVGAGHAIQHQSADPVTQVVVTVVLGIVALLASWLPARRATRIDPIETLRAE